ncbi:DEAD/DEAH box helicase [Clostridium butyricum]|uniref:DEAD/DEAH box helicase n=1 Tax=Clostridium butyricum TaxID=1492 RepID=UPI003D346DA8
MKKEEYINHIKNQLNKLINDKTIDNYKSQMYAVYLGAEIKSTYSEKYLWKHAMFLSSNSTILLEEDLFDPVGLKCIKMSAEIYELFSKVSKEYDREYCSLLSSLCYDIAGYQANAICMLKSQEQYIISSHEDEVADEFIESDNYVFLHIQSILLKKIPYANENIKNDEEDIGKSCFNNAVISFYKSILNGENLDYEKSMKEATLYFYRTGNVYISQILHLINVRFKMYTERSIRKNLAKYIDLENPVWSKYVKLLAFDFYDKHSIRKIDNRTSIFEFWQSQLKALRDGLLKLENSSFVVQMPTSAGKTFIAELIILKKLIEHPGKKIIYIAPYRALRNEKELELGKNLSKLGYTISTISGSYEVDELYQPIVEDTDVLIATPEKIDLMLRLDKDLFRDLSLLVVDEGHMIGNLFKLTLPLVIERKKLTEEVMKNMKESEIKLFNRYYNFRKNQWHINTYTNARNSEKNILFKVFLKLGIIEYEIDDRSNLLEFLIARLLYINESLQVLFLSAVMPKINSKTLSKWLSNSEDRVIDSRNELNEIWEPTRRNFGNILANEKLKTVLIRYPQIKLSENRVAFVPNFVSEERIKFINSKTKRYNTFKFPDFEKKSDICAAVVLRLIKNKLGNCLIFAAQPNNVLAIAGSFATYFKYKQLSNPEQSEFIDTESNESYYQAKRLYGADNDISICLKHGIGVHYGRMYEAVRKAVEDDFRNNRLNALIATNTVGQGLNFPIKNIIIHSLDINPTINKSLSVRDFWNVVGRAGRAGKETEGQILFVTLKERDSNIFNYYTNIENIESVESSYLNVINDMVENRITDNTFIKQTDFLMEPFLLDLLSEEYFTDDDSIVTKICNNSLAGVQIADNKEKQIILYKGIYDTIGRIRSEVADFESIKKYSKTGFHVKSNKVIEDFIELNVSEIKNILKIDDYNNLIKLYIKLLYCNNIEELIINKKYDISIINIDDFTRLILRWISGASLSDLKEEWRIITENKCDLKFEEFVEAGLLYRYPWGITALLEQIQYIPQVGKLIESPNIMNSATFVKCGIDDILGCYLNALGMKNRTQIKNICEEFRKNNQYHGYNDFIKWIINLSIDEINQFKLNKYDYKDFINVVYNLSRRYIHNGSLNSTSGVKFYIKGVKLDKERRKNSKMIDLSNEITYKRDYRNIYDPYSIQFYYNEKLIGSLPTELSMYIATEIDLNGSKYKIIINEIKEYEDYNNINVTMKLIN